MVLAALACAGALSAAPIIGVFPSIGPDWVLSPGSFTAYQGNTVFALEHNFSSWGTAGTPGYYERTWSYNSTDLFGTDFYSWRAQAPPPAGYATETGNGLYFGMIIRGAGELFTLADVNYDENFFGSVGPTTNLGGAENFGAGLVGLYYGPDRIPGTPDDIRYDTAQPDSASLLLDEVYFAGFGVQFYASTPAQLASYLDVVRRSNPNSSTGTYSIGLGSGGYSQSATATLGDAIPEPATIGLVGLGLLLVGFRGRRSVKK